MVSKLTLRGGLGVQLLVWCLLIRVVGDGGVSDMVSSSNSGGGRGCVTRY